MISQTKTFRRITRRLVLPLLLLPSSTFSTYHPSTGPCQLSPSWQSLPLLSSHKLTNQTSTFTYSLPSSTESLNLSPCACILVRNPSGIVRPYTPTSNNSLKGSFTLTVKLYQNGVLSNSIFKNEPLEFCHINKNVKLQYPLSTSIKRVLLIAGGTGITPINQLLECIDSEGDTVKEVVVFIGDQSSDDVINLECISALEQTNSPKFKIIRAYSGGENGRFIDEDAIRQHFVKSEGDCLAAICGPPPMMTSICGDREDSDVTGALKRLGWKKDEVYKF
ncbi:hypothetical protein TrLO_g9140 [Triparma laevis f. longispina]|uniref:cytochrome-b5 reductase n=1 Tax=Triparma laevis f. longispina TaxID=1714387 RepID=A0A9W7E0Z6_9STRA|nr:hypothetical protein TrLO_g9140 [Triparma laevis f. longispina]